MRVYLEDENEEIIEQLQKENAQLKEELKNKDAVRLWNENEDLKRKLDIAKAGLNRCKHILICYEDVKTDSPDTLDEYLAFKGIGLITQALKEIGE